MTERGRELRTYERPDGLFIGTPQALAAMARGDTNVLVSRPRTLPDGRKVTNVRLATRDELRLPGEQATRPGLPVALVAGGAVAAGVALAVLVALVALAWVAAHLALVVGLVVILVAVLYVLGAALTRCPGLHCVGCRH